MTDPRLGLTVTHRRYVPYSHAHYGGNLVDGAYSLGLFGDVATEVAIVMDGDEGLLAGYSDIRFLGPVHAGDVLVLGDDTIHSVANTRNEYAVAIHVYGNDFFAPGRVEWDFETFTERPRDAEGIRRTFADANARWAAKPESF